MLKKLKVKNFFSIYDEISLDFKKSNYTFKDKMIIEDIVNPIGVYGLNGSGKTTLLKSIYAISMLMYKSVSLQDSFVLPNLLDKNKDVDANSSFQFTINIDDYEYEYFIEIKMYNGIQKEYLKNLTTNETYFTRTSEEYSYLNETKEVEGKLYPTLRFIGKENSNNEYGKQITKIYEFFKDIVYIDSNGNVFSDFTEKTNISDLIVEKSEDIKKVIQNYGDFPVYDIKKSESDELSKTIFIRMEHSKRALPYVLASNGIKTHNKLIAMLLTMSKNSLILVDELERNLHPLIAQKVVDRMNTLSIQMIFTSHNTNLLQKLRPDQIVFANWEKDENETKYKKLSDIYPNIREVNNIEKMYFGGLFEEE